MAETKKTPTIQEAMVQAMKAIGAVRKGERNSHQNFLFRGIDAVVNAASPALQKAGIVVTPKLESLERRTMQTSRGNAMNGVDVIVTYTFTGPAGDSLSATVAGEAFDSGDKAVPKAMSVAFRIALLQALALPTDEPDPDHESHEATPIQRSQNAPQQAPAAQQGQTPEQALQQHWDSLEGLESLRKWATKVGAPAQYLQQIRSRMQELSTQNNPSK